MAETARKKLTLKASTRPLHLGDRSTQAQRNSQRTGIPLMTIVNQEAHERIKAIGNSENYQAAHSQNVQSALQAPKIQGKQHGRFLVFDINEPNNGSQADLPAQPTVSNSSSVQIGRFSVSDTPTSIKIGRFDVSESNGGRRRRKTRRNISRRRRYVNRRRTYRNGA